MKKSMGILFLVVFVDLVGFGIVIPMLPLYARDFQATASDVGALMFVYSLMQMIISPFWGGLSDRWGRKPILVLTMFGQAVGYILAAASHDFSQLLWSRALAGLFAGNISTANAFMADLTTSEKRSTGMGLMGAAFGMGFILGPVIAGSVLSFGREAPFILAAALCWINAVVAIFVLKESTSRSLRAQNRRKLSWLELISFSLSKRMIFIVLTSFFIVLAMTQLEVSFTLFVVDRFHLEANKAFYLLGAMGLVMAIVQGGLIGRLNKKYHETRLALTGAFGLVLGLSLIIFSWSLSSLGVAIVILAVGYSLASPCLMSLLSKAAAESRQGLAFGIYQSVSSLARILGPLMAGKLYDIRLDLPFAAGIICVVLGGVFLVSELFLNQPRLGLSKENL